MRRQQPAGYLAERIARETTTRSAINTEHAAKRLTLVCSTLSQSVTGLCPNHGREGQCSWYGNPNV
jgi:hypothetical protein